MDDRIRLKRRKINPLNESDAVVSSKFYDNASKWNLEEAYDKRTKNIKKRNKQSSKLPIKDQGAIRQFVAEGTGSDDGKTQEPEEEEVAEAVKDHVPEEQYTQEEEKSPKEQIMDAKEDLARMAGFLSEDPEEHIGQLRNMAKIGTSRNATVKKLAIATQLAVFKDIIPGYRIRALSDEDMKAKVSKDVKRMRNFEQTLVVCYRDYVHGLGRITKAATRRDPSPVQVSMASAAYTCACALLTSVPHFNFRGDLLNIMVNKLSSRQVDRESQKCVEALETLFENDDDGKASLETVSLLTKMMKTKDYNVHETVLNTFLQLRLLSEYSYRASTQRVDNRTAEDEQPDIKIKKKNREFRTKKQRKILREQKSIQKEFNEADATVSHEERDKNQSEMLKMVFVAYFRILKLRKQNLMGAVLEGLARYAHLINQDFFGDILESLRDLLATQNLDDEEEDDIIDEASQRDMSREALLCTVTAFALLQGQDVAKAASSLHLDLSFFTTQLYNSIISHSLNPSIEKAAERQSAATASVIEDGKSKRKINVQTPSLLLLRSLTSLLLPPQQARSIPPTLLAAFIKKLMTASLHLPEKSAIAMLGLVKQVVKVHGNKVVGMWYSEERKGDGLYDMEREEWGSANPFAGVMWEGEMLGCHWSEKVREAAKEVQDAVVSRRT